MTAAAEPITGARKVMLVDDHPIVRHGLAQLIALEPDLDVCLEAGTVAETLEKLKTVTPDVAVVDLSLEGESGLALIKDIRQRYPDVRVLVSSIHDERTFAARSLRAGAMGYIQKRESITKIVDAIHAILAGEVYLSPEMSRQLLRRAASGGSTDGDPLSVLSDREIEVFEMIGRGRTTKQIARHLTISPKTVETHRKKIKEKLGLKSGAQLNRRAYDWVRDQE